MATIQNATDLKYWLNQLQEAIKTKNKRSILSVYDKFSEYDFNWDKYPSYFKRYDKLTDMGNDILYS